jgi:transcriptional regulator of acetoin/glycerol metabolism
MLEKQPVAGLRGGLEPLHAGRSRAVVAGPADDADTMQAWERFLTGEPGAAVPLSHFVVSSWQRSLASGVDPAGRSAPLAAEGDLISELRHHHHDMLAAAADIFARTAALFDGSRSMMLLTDPDGVVLEAAGDRQTLHEGERIHLMAGGHWSEAVIGTNGIGTAISTGRPAQVHAAEHFCEGIKSWTCAAAPIHDPASGALLGVVDISGPPSTYQRNNLMLAVTTARQIEAVLAERANFERAHLLEACLQRQPQGGAAGMLVIDRAGRVVYMNGQLAAPAKLGVRLGQRLGGFDLNLPPEAWQGHLPEPLRVDGFDPVMLDGRPIGAMLIVPNRVSRSSDARSLIDARAIASSEADHSRSGFASIIGASAAMMATIARARQLARPRVPILIEGETGTGKELLARAIHGENDPNAPFITFNCGAASKELIGAELFGHVRGAFTGATAEGKPGRFELAHGGTLCLDEIGELPLDLQPILLRALEEGVIYRLGDTTPRRVAVRLLAMTNRDLREEVAARRFRADLFYRVNVTAIRLPPLRERHGDIDLLTGHFSRLLAARHGVPVRSFGSEVMAALRGHAWPGNVRELRNLIEGLLLASDGGPVTLAELPPEIQGEPSSLAAPDRLDDVERAAVQRAIHQAHGNMAGAARQLGVSRSTLYRMLRRFELAT